MWRLIWKPNSNEIWASLCPSAFAISVQLLSCHFFQLRSFFAVHWSLNRLPFYRVGLTGNLTENYFCNTYTKLKEYFNGKKVRNTIYVSIKGKWVFIWFLFPYSSTKISSFVFLHNWVINYTTWTMGNKLGSFLFNHHVFVFPWYLSLDNCPKCFTSLNPRRLCLCSFVLNCVLSPLSALRLPFTINYNANQWQPSLNVLHSLSLPFCFWLHLLGAIGFVYIQVPTILFSNWKAN